MKLNNKINPHNITTASVSSAIVGLVLAGDCPQKEFVAVAIPIVMSIITSLLMWVSVYFGFESQAEMKATKAADKLIATAKSALENEHLTSSQLKQWTDKLNRGYEAKAQAAIVHMSPTASNKKK